MGRQSKSRYAKARTNYNLLEYVVPKKSTAASDPFGLINQLGFMPGVPYSDKKGGLWELKSIMQDMGEDQENLAMVQFDPYSQQMGEVHYKDKCSKASNVQSLLKQSAQDPSDEVNKLTKNTTKPRDSAKKTLHHKSHRLPLVDKPKTVPIESTNALSYLLIRPETKQLKKRNLGCCYYCGDFLNLERKKTDKAWTEYLRSGYHMDEDDEEYEYHETEFQPEQGQRDMQWNIEAFLEPVVSNEMCLDALAGFTDLSSEDSDWVMVSSSAEP
ncbi:hypothetical protein Ciccas_009138 [Cichlidogyrus casuarinus]|uniref:Uncharacterized protein n=1 Tax=Cichlidogyrus casuarinus TaxID=1844966 RepID=A0ABD2PYW9_9PLAT